MFDRPSAPDASTMTGRRGTVVGVSILVGLAVFIGLSLVMPLDVNMFDEGIVLSDAMRVAAGEVVHRDFYSSYGPAQYYVVAAALKISDDSFLATRLYDIATKAIVCALLFYVVREVCGRVVGLIVTAAAALWFLAFATFPLYPIYPCMVLGLVGTYLMVPVSLGTDRRASPILAAGACAGLAAIFRYDVGFFLLVANLLGAGVLIWLDETPSRALRRYVGLIVAYGIGTSLVFVPAATAFLLVAPLGDFWRDIVDYSSKYYSAMRGLPFPKPWAREAGGIYFAPVVATLALVEIVRISRAGPRLDTASRQAVARAYLILFGLCSLLFFVKGSVRVSALHMVLGNVPALVVAGILVQRWVHGSRPTRLAAALLVLLTLGPAMALGGLELRRNVSSPEGNLGRLMAEQVGFRRNGEPGCLTTAHSVVARYQPDYALIANYVARRTRRDERIFVAVSRHDKLFINPVAMYFAANRLPGTHWHQFDPGLQTRADTQAAIIADLQRYNVRWVVRDASFDDINEPNGSARSSGVVLLDRYLDDHYRVAASAGRVTAWLSKTEAPPDLGAPAACEAKPVE